VNVNVRRRPGRPAGGQHVVDRDVVLDAAERVIARDGNGASLEAIAVEAGVTKPVVYARVGSRAELSNALAARLAERLIAAAGAEIGNGSRLDRIILAAFFRSSLETIGAHRELFLYVTRGAADDTPERTLYLAGRSAAPLAELLADWRTRRGDDVAVAVPWAYAIVGMLNLVSLWWIDERDRPADVLADQLAELVWSGLAAGATGATGATGRQR
jgi:AcrR family transcriptional regulator